MNEIVIRILAGEKVDTKNVTNMSYMFWGAEFDKILKFNTSMITNMRGMFAGTHFNKIPKFNTENVTNMWGMFRDAYFDKIPKFDTKNVTDMFGMFENTIFNKIPKLDLTNVKDMRYMFEGSNLKTQIKNCGTKNRTVYKYQNIYFAGCFFGTFEELILKAKEEKEYLEEDMKKLEILKNMKEVYEE